MFWYYLMIFIHNFIGLNPVIWQSTICLFWYYFIKKSYWLGFTFTLAIWADFLYEKCDDNKTVFRICNSKTSNTVAKKLNKKQNYNTVKTAPIYKTTNDRQNITQKTNWVTQTPLINNQRCTWVLRKFN